MIELTTVRHNMKYMLRFLLVLSLLSIATSWSNLMTCSNFPNMGLNTNLLKMGTTAASYSTNQIFINGVAVAGSTGTYTPGSTITVSLSPYSGQLVFQANSGAVFQGAAGSRNVNGIISGCSTVSRYQMYTNTVASLKMPAFGTVTIECNFATTSGSGATKVTKPIILTPAVASTSKPVSAPTIVPISTFKPSTIRPISKAPTNKPMLSPTMYPTYAPSSKILPTSKPIFSPTVTPSILPTKYPTFKPTIKPTYLPGSPTNLPSLSLKPTYIPTKVPSRLPTEIPSQPSYTPTKNPTSKPTVGPMSTNSPSNPPSLKPIFTPTKSPIIAPTNKPSIAVSSLQPSNVYTQTLEPSIDPTVSSAEPTIDAIVPSIKPSKSKDPENGVNGANALSGSSSGNQVFFILGAISLIVLSSVGLFIAILAYNARMRDDNQKTTGEPKDLENNSFADIYNDQEPSRNHDHEDTIDGLEGPINDDDNYIEDDIVASEELPSDRSNTRRKSNTTEKSFRKSEQIDPEMLKNIINRKLSVDFRDSFKGSKANPMYYNR